VPPHRRGLREGLDAAPPTDPYFAGDAELRRFAHEVMVEHAVG
jgi:hypothetical protein